jgi:hypothetical protein
MVILKIGMVLCNTVHMVTNLLSIYIFFCVYTLFRSQRRIMTFNMNTTLMVLVSFHSFSNM